MLNWGRPNQRNSRPLGPRANVMAMLLVKGGEMSGSTGMAPRAHFSGRGRFIRVTANAKTKPSSTPARDTARAR